MEEKEKEGTKKEKRKKKEKEKKNIREISFSLFSLLFFLPPFLLFPTKDLTGISSNSFNESKECQRVSPRCTHTHTHTHTRTHARTHKYTHTRIPISRVAGLNLSPLFLENFFRYIEPREPIDQLWWIVFCTDAISGSTRPETYEEGEWGRTDDSRRRSVNRNRRSSRKIIRVTNPPLESSGREPETEAWQQLGQLGQRLISFW